MGCETVWKRTHVVRNQNPTLVSPGGEVGMVPASLFNEVRTVVAGMAVCLG
jgi:hypothetical protein